VFISQGQRTVNYSLEELFGLRIALTQTAQACQTLQRIKVGGVALQGFLQALLAGLLCVWVIAERHCHVQLCNRGKGTRALAPDQFCLDSILRLRMTLEIQVEHLNSFAVDLYCFSTLKHFGSAEVLLTILVGIKLYRPLNEFTSLRMLAKLNQQVRVLVDD